MQFEPKQRRTTGQQEKSSSGDEGNIPEQQIWVPIAIISTVVFVAVICTTVFIIWKKRCQYRSNRQVKENYSIFVKN